MTSESHLPYLERLLEGAVRRQEASEFLYVTRTEGMTGFWELVGFRVPGLERALVGAVHFLSQSDDPLAFARRSLGHFLSSPPQALNLARSSFPADVIEVRVPREGETLPELLGALKRDEATARLYLDTELIELALDFRPGNPSLQRAKAESGPTQRLVFRTRLGHVIRATATNLAVKLRRAGTFVPLTEVEQRVTVGGATEAARWIPLPTMVVRRDFLTMVMEAEDGDAQLPAVFTPSATANGHLLDGRLSTAAAP